MTTTLKINKILQPRPIKKPKYNGVEGDTLRLSSIEGDTVTSNFHFPGHTGVEGLKMCEISIQSHSVSIWLQAIQFGNAANMPEEYIEWKIPKEYFQREAQLKYRLNYRFEDGTTIQYRDESRSYNVVP